MVLGLFGVLGWRVLIVDTFAGSNSLNKERFEFSTTGQIVFSTTERTTIRFDFAFKMQIKR